MTSNLENQNRPMVAGSNPKAECSQTRPSAFMQFVAAKLHDSSQRPPRNSSDAQRIELLAILNHHFATGYAGPSSEYELIGFTWRHVADRCDSPLLCAAEKVWLEFEEIEQH